MPPAQSPRPQVPDAEASATAPGKTTEIRYADGRIEHPLVGREASDIKLGGVNQKVSILFADIRGFTGIAEKLEPQQVVEILNEFFGRVTEVIFDHFGTLDRYLGDVLMAICGAPYSKGNDAANFHLRMP